MPESPQEPLAAPPPIDAATPAEPSAPPAPPRRIRTGRVVLAVVVAALAFVGWEVATWPDVAALRTKNPKTTAFIERWRERQRDAGKSDRPSWRPVPYARISPNLKRAVLVSEDIGFFSHHGFAVEEMRASLEDAWEERELPRGASTLTQQLAKNLWLSPSYNPLRKVKEAILTWQLERTLSKRRILELYLNVMELGPGVYGADAGARRWFGTSAAGLSESQAAALAASLPNPREWHPGTGNRRAARRTQIVLRRMAKARFLWGEI